MKTLKYKNKYKTAFRSSVSWMWLEETMSGQPVALKAINEINVD